MSDAEIQEEAETEIGDLIEDEGEEVAGSSAADDDQPPEMPVTRRRFAPSSIGLTVLVPATVRAVTVVVTWGDYTTEPPLTTLQLTEEGADRARGRVAAPAARRRRSSWPCRTPARAGRSWCRTAPHRGCRAGRSSWSPMPARSRSSRRARRP